jgi:hypothetical protein
MEKKLEEREARRRSADFGLRLNRLLQASGCHGPASFKDAHMTEKPSEASGARPLRPPTSGTTSTSA